MALTDEVTSGSSPAGNGRRRAGSPRDKAAPRFTLNPNITQKHIKRSELVHMSRQLSAFTRAGITLLRALDVLRTDGESEAVRRVATGMQVQLADGVPLSAVIDGYPKDFPHFYRRMMRAAEMTGRLDDVLDQLATYLERDLEARQKVKSSLTYPAIVVGMALVTVSILCISVLPKFQIFFTSLNAKLPFATRALLNGAHFVGQWGLAIAAALIMLGIGLAWVRHQPWGKLRFDRLLLRLPLVGPIVQLALTERFCRLIASLERSGVGLLAGLGVAGEALSNAVYVEAIVEVERLVINGGSLSSALNSTGVMPGTALQMIRVGEETGSLPEQLDVAADYYAAELDYKLKRLTTLIEPAVVVGVGISVGFVAVALISAMYGIFRQVH